MIKCGMLASKNAIARLTTTRTNTIGYIMVCMYVSLAHTQRETSAPTDYLRTSNYHHLLYNYTKLSTFYPIISLCTKIVFICIFISRIPPSTPLPFSSFSSNFYEKQSYYRKNEKKNGKSISALLRAGLKVSLLQNAALH